MSLPQTHAYWMSDALRMSLRVNKSKVSGKGKLKVPTFAPLRLVCPVEVKADMHRKKVEESALLVKVRGDLNIVLGYDGAEGYMWLVDESKVKLKGLFKGARSLSVVEKRLETGIVRRYRTEEDGWVPLVESMGG